MSYHNTNTNDDDDIYNESERLRSIDYEISLAERSIGTLRRMKGTLNDRLRTIDILANESNIPMVSSSSPSSSSSAAAALGNIDSQFRRSSEELFIRYNNKDSNDIENTTTTTTKPPRRSYSTNSPNRYTINNDNKISKVQWNRSWGNSTDDDMSFLKSSSRSSYYSTTSSNDDIDLNNTTTDPNLWNPYPILINNNIINVSTGITSMLTATMNTLDARIPPPSAEVASSSSSSLSLSLSSSSSSLSSSLSSSSLSSSL